jgi:peptide/nickel transport system ATP-binding protein
MTAPLLDVRDLRIDFKLHGQGRVRAVDNVSFTIPKGRTVALVGESGSGKSVLSQAILRILPLSAHITHGQILFADPLNGSGPAVDLASLARDGEAIRRIRGGRISMIFQEPMTSLSPLHTVGNQIMEAVRLHRRADNATARELTGEMLGRVGFPDPVKAIDIYPFELSGGLRQRAMIAMALVCHPVLLIADEPTTALDVTIQAQILQLMKDLQTELQMSLLLITHDLGVVANMADEVVVVYHGKVMERGGLDDIYYRPEHPYLKALLRAVPRVGMGDGERLTPIREVPSVDARATERATPARQDRETDGPLLVVSGVSKTFFTRNSGFLDGGGGGAVHALCDVSLDLQRGECLGLVGESGCGKTTLSKVIMRAVKPDSGDITYDKRGAATNLLGLDGERLIEFRRRMQFIFQDPFSSLNPRMTVSDIISEPLVIHAMGNKEERRARVIDLMHKVGLDPRFLSRYPHSFSGGQRQRIGIARALALNPEMLICDEPVSALDVSVQAQILNLLKDLQAELGLTYLFVSHNLAVVDYMADRIAVMCAGRLVEIAPRKTLFQNPVHPYTRALLAAVPRADPECKLDLSALMEGKVSDPDTWPVPFTESAETRPGLVEVDQGHFVRANESLRAELRTS